MSTSSKRAQGSVAQFKISLLDFTSHGFGLVVHSLVLTTAILPSSPTKTPVVTCCPPGSFLAIEDSLKSRQLPNGKKEGSEPYKYNWDEGSVSQLPQQHNSPMLAHKSFHRAYDFRHNYISSVYCVPDLNSLPPIYGFAGSSYPHTILEFMAIILL